MIFNYLFGIKEVDKSKVKINCREAVRAVIFNGDNLLMVFNNKGDYKFPGGGVNKRENHEEALKREVREETGYIVTNVKECLGIFTQRDLDIYEKNSVFEMISSYYLCEISDAKTIQQLDAYESELGFEPKWITLDDAITFNEEILRKDDKGRNRWVDRELTVLKALREYYNKSFN